MNNIRRVAYRTTTKLYDYTKRCRDSRFFALNEMNLSIFDGDSSNEEEKSRISVIKTTQKS